MHAFGVDDTLQFLALFSCCLDVDQFKRAQVVWFWEVLKYCHCDSRFGLLAREAARSQTRTDDWHLFQP